MIGNLADDACTPSHTRRLFEAIGHPDKEMHEIAGANHYYAGPDQRDTLREAVGIVHGLAARHEFRGGAVTPTGPLDGIRVIEVGTLISGPFAGRLLGDMGAEVIKIEPPGAPDPLRTWGQAELDGHHFFWTVHARNKKAVTLEPARAARAATCSSTSSSAPTSSSRTSGRARWRSGTWATTFCANATRASSWCGCPATARPARTRTRPATPRSPRPPAACAT